MGSPLVADDGRSILEAIQRAEYALVAFTIVHRHLSENESLSRLGLSRRRVFHNVSCVSGAAPEREVGAYLRAACLLYLLTASS